jgi:phosphoglycolate phosphatase-like HAD superfamily hydrolase
LILLAGVREAVARRRREAESETGHREQGGRGGESGAADGRAPPPPPPPLYTHEEAFALLKEAERAMTSFYELAATDAAVAAEGLSLLPGVEALLGNLAGRRGVVQGLVTGNLQPIGWRKVETLGVAHFFDAIVSNGEGGEGDRREGGGEGEEEAEEEGSTRSTATRRVGGFGSDFCSADEGAIDEPWRDRARFVEIAAERALRTAAAADAAAASASSSSFPSSSPPVVARKVHVGDTPHDLRAAAAAGALPVGVATGIFSREELVAAGVPGAVILDDLSDLEASLRAMGF